MMAELPDVEDISAVIRTNNGDNGLEPIIMGISRTFEQANLEAPDMIKGIPKNNSFLCIVTQNRAVMDLAILGVFKDMKAADEHAWRWAEANFQIVQTTQMKKGAGSG